MMRVLTIVIAFLLLFIPGFAQDQESIYKLNRKVELPATFAAAGLSAYGFYKVFSKDVDTQEVLSLDPSQISKFNRNGASVYSSTGDRNSNFFFYPAYVFPALLLLDGEVRNQWQEVYFLYFQALALTSMSYSLTAGHVDKYRPYAYNPNAPDELRLSGNAKNSFFGGHPAIVGMSSFFVARVYDDLHPESSFKWVLYGAAGLATAATAFYRHRAGAHFPTDLIIGSLIGTGIGMLVPLLHKKKEEPRALLPY